MFTSLAAPDSGQGMPVIGRGDHNGIDTLVVQYASQVCDRFRCGLLYFTNRLAIRIQQRLIHIADVCGPARRAGRQNCALPPNLGRARR